MALFAFLGSLMIAYFHELMGHLCASLKKYRSNLLLILKGKKRPNKMLTLEDLGYVPGEKVDFFLEVRWFLWLIQGNQELEIPAGSRWWRTFNIKRSFYIFSVNERDYNLGCDGS